MTGRADCEHRPVDVVLSREQLAQLGEASRPQEVLGLWRGMRQRSTTAAIMAACALISRPRRALAETKFVPPAA